MPPQSAVLLPIGRSPIHCLRLARCFSKNRVSLIILAVTKDTIGPGEIIRDMETGSGTEYVVCEYSDVKSEIRAKPGIVDWSVVFGPGTRDMQVSLWHDVISVTEKPPKHWVAHTRKAGGGRGNNISPEMLINLSNKAESYELGQVSEDDAMKLTSISIETYSQIEGLSWINHQSKFSFHISLPENASELEKDQARKWEEMVYHRVNEAWKIFGKHALKITRDPLPSSPKWWSNVGERFRDFGIGGGNK